MSEIFINKVLKHNTISLETKCFLYMKTNWSDEEVQITLQDSETGKCYRGLCPTTHLRDVANDLEMIYSEYYEMCRLLLTTSKPTADFIYVLDDIEKQLQIKKSLLNCLYLDINIKEIKNHYEIFDAALDLLNNKDETLTQRVDIAHKYDKHYAELQEDVEKMIAEKNQLERSLLKKAAALLNTKKLKIVELQKRLRKYEDESNGLLEDDEQRMETTSDNDDNVACSSTFRKRKTQIIDTDTSDEEDDKRKRISSQDKDDSFTNDSDETFIADTEPLTLPL